MTTRDNAPCPDGWVCEPRITDEQIREIAARNTIRWAETLQLLQDAETAENAAGLSSDAPTTRTPSSRRQQTRPTLPRQVQQRRY